MLTEARSIPSGWRVVDPSASDLCQGGGQLLAPLTFSTGDTIRPLAKSLNDRAECSVCGRIVAVIADYDGDSIAPHRLSGAPMAATGDQLGLFDG